VELRETFDRDGVVRVAGAIPIDLARAMAARVRERLREIEFVELAGALRPARGTELDLWEIGRDPALAALPGALARAVDRVFGAGVWSQVAGEEGGLPMPNLPCSGVRWRASEVSWHVDEASLPAAPARVLLGYALLDRVEPQGGATVALAGSHRRLAAIADRLGAPLGHADACAALARDDAWFAELLRGGEPPAPGSELRLVELGGEAGDLVLFDPRCLHTISANVSPRPRLVMRLTCARAA
jgi:hypothetical protein